MRASVFIGATTLEPGNGGIGRVARMSARALIEAGYAVDMAALLDTEVSTIAGRVGAAVHGRKIEFAARCHAAALRHDWFLYDSAGPARAHPRLPGLRRPYAVWIHGAEVWGIPQLRPDYVAAVRRADLVLVNSHYTLARAERTIGPLPQARVCWLATEEDDEAAPPSVVPRHPPTVLILGRIDADENYKGHAELVDAWPRVVAAVPEARLLIAGGGSGLAALRARVAASPSAQSIECLGFVAEAAIASLWRRASIFAMPSRGEGFGLVYIEAMRHAVPVIASVHDAGAEVNITGVTGFNVSLDSSDDLAVRLIELLKDRHLCGRMGGAGQQRWREHFQYAAFSRRLSALIETALSQ